MTNPPPRREPPLFPDEEPDSEPVEPVPSDDMDPQVPDRAPGGLDENLE